MARPSSSKLLIFSAFLFFSSFFILMAAANDVSREEDPMAPCPDSDMFKRFSAETSKGLCAILFAAATGAEGFGDYLRGVNCRPVKQQAHTLQPDRDNPCTVAPYLLNNADCATEVLGARFFPRSPDLQTNVDEVLSRCRDFYGASNPKH